MDSVNKSTKPYKTRRPTGARFEMFASPSSGKAVNIIAGNDGCFVKISLFSKDGEVEYKEVRDEIDILDKIEVITNKYGLSEIGELPLSSTSGERAFSIDYGINTRYFIRNNQELPDNITKMLDEIEKVLSPYLSASLYDSVSVGNMIEFDKIEKRPVDDGDWKFFGMAAAVVFIVMIVFVIKVIVL